MNQNRELRDRAGTADGLEKRDAGEDAQVAALMRSQMPAK
jgi:predicted FMN-binding regulatory protein PaiB